MLLENIKILLMQEKRKKIVLLWTCIQGYWMSCFGLAR